MRNAAGLMLASVVAAVVIAGVWFWTSHPGHELAPQIVAAAPALKIFRVQLSQIVGASSHGYIHTGRLERDLFEERPV